MSLSVVCHACDAEQSRARVSFEYFRPMRIGNMFRALLELAVKIKMPCRKTTFHHLPCEMLMKRPTGAASTTAIVTRVASSRSGVGGGKENATNAKQPLPLEQRPEFTVLMKAKVRVPGERVGKEPPHHELKKSLPSRTEVILALRERTAQNLSYEGILNDQLVMQKALLIRTQAASYGHDPLVVMSYVGQRAQEAVEEDVGRIINELTELHGPHPTHRVTAYAELSTDLGKQLESVVFDQHFDKVMQISQEFKLREEELKAKEKTTNQAVEVQKEEINNLVKANIELEQVRACVGVWVVKWAGGLLPEVTSLVHFGLQEKKAMERMTEMMKKEVEEALHAQLQAQQKLVRPLATACSLFRSVGPLIACRLRVSAARWRSACRGWTTRPRWTAASRRSWCRWSRRWATSLTPWRSSSSTCSSSRCAFAPPGSCGVGWSRHQPPSPRSSRCAVEAPSHAGHLLHAV